MTMKGKSHGALWSVRGGVWVWRRPFFQAKKWRVQRRHVLAGHIEVVTLHEAENKSQAKDMVRALAAKDEKEAAEARAAGIPAEPRDETLERALKGWLAQCDVRPSTRAGYERACNVFAELLGEASVVSRIGYGNVEALFTEHWQGNTGRTKILYRGLLVRFFDWAIKKGYTRTNPARQVDIQRKWSREASDAAQETGQALTHEEARRLLEKCREPRAVSFRPDVDGKETDHEPPGQLWWFVFLSLRTGLRSSNLLGLPDTKDDEGRVLPGKPALVWRNVDLDAGTLDIPKEHMKGNRRLFVPLHREAVRALKHLRADLLKKNGRVPADDQRIIPEVAHVRRSFDSALKRAGLHKRERPIRIHDLRHTVNTWLEEEASSKATADLMGHKAKTMTEKYTHHRMEKLREHLDRLPDLAQGAPPPAKREPKKGAKKAAG